MVCLAILEGRGLNQLQIARFRFNCRVRMPGTHPSFLGAGVRGAFGRSLRILSNCEHPEVEKDASCQACPQRQSCCYTNVFKPYLLGRSEANPKKIAPFSIDLTNHAHTSEAHEYKSGEAYAVTISLLGEAVISWSHEIILAMAHALQSFFVTQEGFLRLDDVTDGIDQSLVFTNDGFSASPQPHVWTDEPVGHCPDRAVLFFHSPLSLENRLRDGAKGEGRFIDDPSIRLVAERVVARAKTVIMSYASQPFSAPEQAHASVDTIETFDEAPFFPAHMGKHSDKDPDRASYGRICLQGDMRLLMPYLLLGSFLHIGKAATYGYGGYMVLAPDKSPGLDDGYHVQEFNEVFSTLILNRS